MIGLFWCAAAVPDPILMHIPTNVLTTTTQGMVGQLEEAIATLQTTLRNLQSQQRVEPPTVFLNELEPQQKVAVKLQHDAMWNGPALLEYLDTDVDDARHALDVHGYIQLVQDGIDLVCQTELPDYESALTPARQRKKRTRIDDLYRTCVSDGLRAMAYQFLPPPVVIGSILEAMETGSAIPPADNRAGRTPSMTPTEFVAAVFGTPGFDPLLRTSVDFDPNDPLYHCRYVAAVELAAEPSVRKHLRKAYRQNVLLTTKPTSKGLQEIDAFHKYYGAHLIRNKPVQAHFLLDLDNPPKMDDDKKTLMEDSRLLFLKILNAEREGLITIHLHLSLLGDPRPDWYKSETATLMANDNQELMKLGEPLRKACLQGNTNVDDWMVERSLIVALAIERFMIPKFERELRRDLQDAAFQKVVREAGLNLKAMAMDGPYLPPHLAKSSSRFVESTGKCKFVGVSCATSKEDATFLALVSERGEAEDNLAIPFDTDLSSNHMRDRITSFLLQHRPSAILVGTTGGHRSQTCMRNLSAFLSHALSQQEKHKDDVAGQWECSIELVDDSVPQLYGRSVRGKKEFPDFSVNYKVAISIARHCNDPLAELTYAWNTASGAGVFGTELLFLDVHALQEYLPRSYLLKEYERVLVTAVAKVGVELNAALKLDHLGGSLLFVPGLGPRKAAQLKRTLAQGVTTRDDLVQKNYLSPRVYRNAAPFFANH